LTVLKPGGLAIGVAGPPDAAFARQLGASSVLGVAMNLLSRKIRKRAKALGVRYEFFFMRADGSRLRDLGVRYDKGELRPVVDRIFPFDATLEAIAHVEQGRAKAGKVVVSMVSED
jgi:NADPH:quinone reductase-like Zn-dependent oxidoreductase